MHTTLKFIWTCVFKDGDVTSLHCWAADWAEANSNAADALARVQDAQSITVELAS